MELNNADLGEPTDLELVSRAQAGEARAFDFLVLRYQKRLYSVIYQITRHHQDTEDVLYETLIKAHGNLKGFKGNSGFHTWLYRIAVNRSLNFIRLRKTNREISIHSGDEEGEGFDIPDEGIVNEVEQQENRSELQKKLNESLARLSEDHRTVVNLFDIQGLSHSEISKILGCSEGTVRSRLHYAHKLLQSYLKDAKKGDR
ncbi:MAG: sigma-70 family RNA polymerase sigma factor [Verrucomicrobiota bacterium]